MLPKPSVLLFGVGMSEVIQMMGVDSLFLLISNPVRI